MVLVQSTILRSKINAYDYWSIGSGGGGMDCLRSHDGRVVSTTGECPYVVASKGSTK